MICAAIRVGLNIEPVKPANKIWTKKNARRFEPEGVWSLRTSPEEPAGGETYFTA